MKENKTEDIRNVVLLGHELVNANIVEGATGSVGQGHDRFDAVLVLSADGNRLAQFHCQRWPDRTGVLVGQLQSHPRDDLQERGRFRQLARHTAFGRQYHGGQGKLGPVEDALPLIWSDRPSNSIAASWRPSDFSSGQCPALPLRSPHRFPAARCANAASVLAA